MMSNAKEIRSKIKSIKNIQKITRAIEMVAISKMQKATKRMLASRPYVLRMQDVISHISRNQWASTHRFIVKRKIKVVGILLVSTDRGLCGGLNTNLFKKAQNILNKYKQQGIPVRFGIFGQKGVSFFKRFGADFISTKIHLDNNPQIHQLIDMVNVMVDAFLNQEISCVKLVYNRFINRMKQEAIIKSLLPVVPKNPDVVHQWDYIYEPDPAQLLDTLLNKYIESTVYQAVVENMACEQAARMIAMKSASDNAGEVIDELQLDYNTARQSTITQELSEIVAGAATV